MKSGLIDLVTPLSRSLTMLLFLNSNSLPCVFFMYLECSLFKVQAMHLVYSFNYLRLRYVTLNELTVNVNIINM